jgi:hypothetical protein
MVIDGLKMMINSTKVIGRTLVIILSTSLISSCSTQKERKINYKETVKKFSDDELCFQWAAHKENDKWQSIRYEEITRRTKAGSPPDCKSWLLKTKTVEQNKRKFRVPSFHTPTETTSSSGGITQRELDEALNNQAREIQRQRQNHDLIHNWKPTYNPDWFKK